ncbi:class I SAM-dependent methyltransferase [Stutzerimonas nitrititolerans]|uniref:class I SAM-dependent methyltransferase n=1 Tax=Stutzerimonas nitrititolerans TaxID=2482751 RepID=UPI00289E24BA|nr:class I SAM-dependent methyltransferase [Stutzerimonas nitrititolerans]
MSLPPKKLGKLKRLLIDTVGTGKHSSYQLLAAPVKSLLGDVGVDIRSKHEPERLVYMLSKVKFQDCTVLDIGCNTGFFLFESLQAGATHVTGYEGSAAHASFVEEATELLQLEKHLTIHSQYYDFESQQGYFDIVLLLNVLHHIGDDYGDPTLTIEQARLSILRQLNRMSHLADRLIFQLGFNWRGDPACGLFAFGTKAEMIDYVREGTSGFWEIEAIGVAGRQNCELIYRDVDERNIQRDDTLGEFLNRPIFIMRSFGAKD